MQTLAISSEPVRQLVEDQAEDVHTQAVSTDPVRQLIEGRAEDLGIPMTQLGTSVGRSRSWMYMYLRRNEPKQLPLDVRARIAKVLYLAESDLFPEPGKRTALYLSSTHSDGIDAPPLRMPDNDDAAQRGKNTVPLFDEQDAIEPMAAREWAPRPSNVTSVGGMFALVIRSNTPRAKPGDMIYVANRPARTGDMAVALRGNRVVAMGELLSMTNGDATFDTAGSVVQLRGTRLLKVTTIATA